MDRRRFVGSLATGGLGVGLPGGPPREEPAVVPQGGGQGGSPKRRPDDGGGQRLSPDAQTDLPGTEYFFLGNGDIVVALQHASGAALDAGLTPLGLMLWDPHHFARKWSTYTFHPEWGLRRGMVTVVVGGTSYVTDPVSLEVRREEVEGVPVVVARWAAGPHLVEERFWVGADAPLLVREVAVTQRGPHPADVSLVTTLYYSHALFTDYRTDHAAGVLRADGLAHVELTADPHPRLWDRYMTVDLGSTAAGGTAAARFTYAIREPVEALTSVPRGVRWEAAVRRWGGVASIETAEPALDHLFRAARDGLRAAVSRAGRFDASIWQYNMEWTMDATGVVEAACCTGQLDLARAVLDNVLTRLVDDRGIAAHASRFHDDLNTELNQQGALLGAAWTYRAWSGDLDLVRRHWETIRRVADFPLGERYLHESGLVQASIELFERDASGGVLPGFDVAHQSLVSWGLQKAAALAAEVGDDLSATRWRQAGARMEDAMLHHPRLALVEDGVLIKRRLPDGSRQRVLRPQAAGADHIPDGTPLAHDRRPLLDPDMGTLWPLLLRQVDAESELATRTLGALGTLWNEEGGGGYLRFHPSADPDAPGGWTFPTAIAGRVLARAGRGEDLRRVLDWFTGVQGSTGGSFFEFYARTPRPVPPLPPMGVIVWGWAEIASLFVGDLLGARVDDSGETLVFDPHLPSGLDRMAGTLRFRDATLAVDVRRTGRRAATAYGRPLSPKPGGFVVPRPVRSGRIGLEVV
jgi:hypothetical protein